MASNCYNVKREQGGQVPSWSRYLRHYLREDLRTTTPTDGRITLAIWRLGQAGHEAPGALGFAMRRLHGFLDFVWTRAVVGAELPRSVPAGPGICLKHAGRGVIIHPGAVLGSRVTLYHRVTIGVRGPGRAPLVLDDCYFGAGASVLGEITVGPDATVGAGAVVISDVPQGHLAVGVPARVTQRTTAPGATQLRPEAV
jgi:serine O-acetyltransferase